MEATDRLVPAVGKNIPVIVTWMARKLRQSRIVIFSNFPSPRRREYQCASCHVGARDEYKPGLAEFIELACDSVFDLPLFHFRLLLFRL